MLISVNTYAAEAVTVRGGVHDDFNRIVFDFPRVPKYTINNEAGDVALTLPAGVTLKPDGLVGKLQRLKLDMTTAGEGIIRLKVAPDAKVSSFVSGDSIVIDVRGPAPAAQPPTSRKEEPAPTKNTPTPKMKEAAQTIPPVLKNAPLATTVTAKDTTPVPPPAPVLPVVPANASSPVAPVMPNLSSTPTLFTEFDPKVSTPAAVYARGDYLYVAFDRRLRFDLNQLFTPTAPGKPETLPIGGFSVYRLPLPVNGRPLVSKKDTKWAVDMIAVDDNQQDPSSVTAQGLRARAEPEFSLGGRVVIPFRGAGQILSLTDPVIGDALFIIPATNLDDHVNEARRFADFELLPSFQGVVIRVLNDALAVRLVEEGIEISAPGGLRLSPPVTAAAAPAQNAVRAPREDVIPLSRWRQPELGDFTEGRQVLQQRIVEAIPSLRDRARLDLARYFAAYAYGPEAKSLLALVAEKNPDIVGRPEFLVLSGVAHILSHDPADGLRALEDSKLSDRDDVRLWRAVAYAEQRAFSDAAADFGATLLLLEDYPQPFFQRFALLAAESFIAAEDDANAARVLEVIAKRLPQGEKMPAVQYLQGVIQARSGSLDIARKLWTAADGSTDYLSRTRAELALVDMDVAAGKTSLADAVRRLEGLRYAWRGDELELEMLARLAEYQLKLGKPMDALDTYERAKVIFPDSPRQKELTEQQQKIFHDVFLGEYKAQFTPLQLLTLYDRYKSLTAADPVEAIKVIDRVVNEMLAIDLLPQAATLLQDRLVNTTDTALKNILVLRLAAVYLLNRQAAEAQKLLTGLDAATLAPDQTEERKLMLARAASDLGQYNDAFTLLDGDTGRDAQRLLATTAWRAKDWPRAATVLGNLVAVPGDEGLKNDEAQLVLARAVALTLANDRDGLNKISADYGAAMDKTTQAQAFALLTRSDLTAGAASLARVREQVSDVDLFQGFLENYRKGTGN